uniref:Ribonuclease H-like domain-containing protein n=1 Tax=Tanacetum cinerariifolium TaxID=118510 RepID=A0A6L2K251_TANCI|nr:ribonuclease H-like domain-containing protein [Tanacetum cinerariifolium]
MAFVSSSNNNNNNGSVNTALEVSTAGTQVNTANIDNLSDPTIYAFLASQPSSPQLVNEDLEQIHPDDLKEMDLRWQMTMLTMRDRRFLKKTRRKLTVNGNDTIGFDKSNVECYNCHKRRHFAREFRAPISQDTKHKESTRRTVPVETSASIALVSCDGLGGYDWSDQAEEGPNYALMAYTFTSSDSKIVDNCKKGLGYESYNAVSPPYIGNFMPPKPDLYYIRLDEFAVKPVVKNKSSEEETKAVRKNHDAPIVEEWVLDDEEENVTQPKIVKKTVKPSIPKIEFIKPRQQKKTARKNVKKVKHNRQNTYRPRGNQRNWNNIMSQRLRSSFKMYNKACYVCGSFDHLQANCNYHQQQFKNQKLVKPYRNHNQRVNHKFFAKKTHPYAKRNMDPKAILLKSGIVNTARQKISKTAVLVNTARQVSTANP